MRSDVRSPSTKRAPQPLAMWALPALVAGLAACAGPLEKALPSTAPAPVRAAAERCDNSDPSGCLTLGRFYWSDEGVRGAARRDVEAALPVLRIACDAQVEGACDLSEEVRVGADAHETLVAAARACDRGDAGACVVVARAWYAGQGVELDADHAVVLFADACAHGVSAACEGSEQTRLRSNATDAVRRLATGCDRQDAQSCRRLGDLYRAGQELPQSLDAWVRTRDRACRFGDAPACAEAGAALLGGGEFARDADRAVRMLRIGCEAGHAPACEPSAEVALGADPPNERLEPARGCDRGDAAACETLGTLLRDGVAGSADAARAAVTFERGCELGSAASCMNLASLRATGGAGQQDVVEAARLFSTACDGGELNACFELGNLYRTGGGVPRNIDLAFRYWNQACDGGLQRACDEMPGQFEALLPSNAPDSVRVMAGACDDGQHVRCLELANAWMLGQNVPRNVAIANRLATFACFNGLEQACAMVQYPGPCRADEVDASGAIRNSENFTYDLAQLRRSGQITETSDTPARSASTVAAHVPSAPAGGDLPETDARAEWTWPEASRQTFYQHGHAVRADEASRNVVVTTPEQVTVDMTFDPSGRLATLVEIAAARRIENSFRWDATGRLVEIARTEGSANTVVSFEYGTGNRLLSVRRTVRDGQRFSELLRTFNYDNRTNLTEMVVETQETRPGETEMVRTRRQTRIIRDAGGNPMRRDVRDAERNVLQATNYDYGCFAR